MNNEGTPALNYFNNVEKNKYKRFYRKGVTDITISQSIVKMNSNKSTTSTLNTTLILNKNSSSNSSNNTNISSFCAKNATITISNFNTAKTEPKSKLVNKYLDRKIKKKGLDLQNTEYLYCNMSRDQLKSLFLDFKFRNNNLEHTDKFKGMSQISNFSNFLYFIRVINLIIFDETSFAIRKIIDNILNYSCLLEEIIETLNLNYYYNLASNNPKALLVYIDFLEEIYNFFKAFFIYYDMNQKLLPITTLLDVVKFINEDILKDNEDIIHYIIDCTEYKKEESNIRQNNTYFLLYNKKIQNLMNEIKNLQRLQCRDFCEKIELMHDMNKEQESPDFTIDIDFYFQSVIIDDINCNIDDIENNISKILIDKHKIIGSYYSWGRYYNTIFNLVKEDFYRGIKVSFLKLKNTYHSYTSDCINQLNNEIKRMQDDFEYIYFYINVKSFQ